MRARVKYINTTSLIFFTRVERKLITITNAFVKYYDGCFPELSGMKNEYNYIWPVEGAVHYNMGSLPTMSTMKKNGEWLLVIFQRER